MPGALLGLYHVVTDTIEPPEVTPDISNSTGNVGETRLLTVGPEVDITMRVGSGTGSLTLEARQSDPETLNQNGGGPGVAAGRAWGGAAMKAEKVYVILELGWGSWRVLIAYMDPQEAQGYVETHRGRSRELQVIEVPLVLAPSSS